MNMVKGTGMGMDNLKVGDSASFSKVVCEDDINTFADITGDKNPVHIDDEYAKNSPFGERIAHGMLSASLISTVLGMKLPGPGAIYQEQTLKFLAPVKIGDTVTAVVEVAEIGPKKKTALLKTTCINQLKIVIVEGMATVRLPRKRKG